MKTLLCLMALSALTFACITLNSSQLTNATLTDDCITISDLNTTITAVSNLSECLVPINRLIYLGNNDSARFPSYNLSVFDNSTPTITYNITNNITNCIMLRNISLTFGQTDAVTNISCSAFPSLDQAITISPGQTWTPSLANYNLSVTSQNCILQRNISKSLDFSESWTDSLSNVSCFGPAYPKRDLTLELGYNQNKTDDLSNVTCAGPPKPFLDLQVNRDPGENYTNEEYGFNLTCRNNLTLRQDFLNCATKTNISGVMVCTDSIISLCGADGLTDLEAGNITPCINRTISGIVTQLGDANTRADAMQTKNEILNNQLSAFNSGTELLKPFASAIAIIGAAYLIFRYGNGLFRKPPASAYQNKPAITKDFIDAEFKKITGV